MNEKGIAASPTAIQVKNQWIMGIEEKFDVISWLEKGEQTVDIRHNVGLSRSSIRRVGYDADRFTESAKSGTKVFVWQHCHSPIKMKCTRNYVCEAGKFLLH